MKKFLILLILSLSFILTACFSGQQEQADLTIKNINMKLISPAFDNNQSIPSEYTCDGENINPPLQISEVPTEAQSLVLIVDDPDAPAGTWVHWTVWNIDPQTTEIAKDSVPAGAVEGMTSFGKTGYGGPCPPSGEHRYFFKLYALDKELDLSASSGKDELEQIMPGHVLDSVELIGLYSRS
jgi:hypothetical protein